MINFAFPSNYPITFGAITTRKASDGGTIGYSVECTHVGLGDQRKIESNDQFILARKCGALVQLWNRRWENRTLLTNAFSPDTATALAQTQLALCEKLLTHAASRDLSADWNSLKSKLPFRWQGNAIEGVHYEKETGEPETVDLTPALIAPSADSPKYVPSLGLLDHFAPSRKQAKLQAADALFKQAMDAYEEAQIRIEKANAAKAARFQEEKVAFESARREYNVRREEVDAKMDQIREAWLAMQPDAIVEHAELLLNSSRYPEWINQQFDLAYAPESKMLVVNYQLPKLGQIPTLERITYVKSRKEIVQKHLPAAKAHKLYDSICYQIALRTILELFRADEPDAISTIAFNGWIEATDKATGRTGPSCLLSVQAFKDEFLALDLTKVDPKTCFNALKGIAASSLSDLVAVRPVIQLDRHDRRFIESHDVAAELNEATNLAAMDWEDFEHLVRELFAKVFSGKGSEVRVTQASRDGGVDAVVLDPDPIKGGKIVIQAKRYTDTVGVSAVRDLYGTVINEGANRGILITTSNFGTDAYKFANGKPLTLMNGANLLSLLAEHGHKARIDLAEARRMG